MIHWMRPRPAPWRGPLVALSMAAGALAFAADVRPALTQTPYDLYRERAALLAAGARCRLFDAAMTAGLRAGLAQARSAALRGGADDAVLDRAAAQARSRVAALPCDGGQVQHAAQRAREAWRAWAGLERMSFPGQAGTWRADRAMPRRSAAWRLSQDGFAGEDRVVFGLAGEGGGQALVLAVAPADGAEPYAARLLLRDPAHASLPALNAPLPARAPPPGAARQILAEARAPADPALRPTGAQAAVAFRFPARAEAALEGLDPREAIGVQLLYPSAGGEVVRTAFLEVGDFDAGVAFLAAGR